MIGIILGITIPILYIAIGSAIGIYIFDRRPDADCRKLPPGQHSRHHTDCGPAAFCGGLLWPASLIFIVVLALMKGKSPKGSRARRWQKKVQKARANIERMEKEMGL